MHAPIPSSWPAPDSRPEPPVRRPDPVERWVAVSAMLLVTLAGMAAVLL